MIHHQAHAPLDVGRLLDEGSWGRYQQGLVALTALTIIFDGADIQLLGIAVPAMMAEWAVPRGRLRQVLASGLFGTLIGGALGGIIGDRFGRSETPRRGRSGISDPLDYSRRRPYGPTGRESVRR